MLGYSYKKESVHKKVQSKLQRNDEVETFSSMYTKNSENISRIIHFL
jgi:hypothetical protein